MIAALPKTLQPAAIEIEGHAGDVACALRAQERNGTRQFLWFAETTECIFLCGKASRLFLFGNTELFLQSASMLAP